MSQASPGDTEEGRPTLTAIGLGVLGVLTLGYGGLLLLDTGWENIWAAARWLIGGVLIHDAVLAPLTIAVTVLGARLLPRSVRGRAAAAFVVIGTVTVVAIPVLDAPGAKPDNPSLLPRDYLQGWLVIVGLTLLVTVGLVLLDRVRSAEAPPQA